MTSLVKYTKREFSKNVVEIPEGVTDPEEIKRLKKRAYQRAYDKMYYSEGKVKKRYVPSVWVALTPDELKARPKSGKGCRATRRKVVDASFI